MEYRIPTVLEQNTDDGKVLYKIESFLGSGGFARCYQVRRLTDN